MAGYFIFRSGDGRVDYLDSNTECRGLITTGVDKFYNNGADLALLWTLKDEDEVQTFRTESQNLFWRLAHFPVPTVAAINGHAFGAGAFIALSHDYRVMRNDKGWISWNEIKNNIQIQVSTINLIRCKLRAGRAKTDAIIYGKRFSGNQALELKIVDAITDMDNLIKEAKTLLNSVLSVGSINRESLRHMKMNIYPRHKNIPSKL